MVRSYLYLTQLALRNKVGYGMNITTTKGTKMNAIEIAGQKLTVRGELPNGKGKPMQISSQFCRCGAHVALVPMARSTAWEAVDYAADRYTPSERRHVCPVAS